MTSRTVVLKLGALVRCRATQGCSKGHGPTMSPCFYMVYGLSSRTKLRFSVLYWLYRSGPYTRDTTNVLVIKILFHN